MELNKLTNTHIKEKNNLAEYIYTHTTQFMQYIKSKQ